MRPSQRARRPAAVLPRIAVILVLGACALYLWFGDPLNADRRRAAQFCESVETGTPVIRIMQDASARGATGFQTPRAELLVVSFGKGRCALPLHGGAVSGETAG